MVCLQVRKTWSTSSARVHFSNSSVNFLDISCSLIQDADDTTGYSSSNNPSTLQINLQSNLAIDLLTSWFRSNVCLTVNHTKSQTRTTLPAPLAIDRNQQDNIS